MRVPHYYKYAIPCPTCGGMVFRHIDFWARVLYLTPLHYFVTARFRCTRCTARFTSKHTASDHFVIIAFGMLALLPPSGVLNYVYCFIIWCLLSIGMQIRRADRPVEVYLACVVLAMVTVLSLHDAKVTARFGEDTFAWMFFGAIFVAFGVARTLIHMDYIARPRLCLSK